MGTSLDMVNLREHWRGSVTYIPNLRELIESIYVTNPTTSAAQGLELGIGTLCARQKQTKIKHCMIYS